MTDYVILASCWPPVRRGPEIKARRTGEVVSGFRPWRLLQRSPASRQREIVILIAATIVAFAFVWYVSLRAAAMSRGGLNVLARAAFLIMTCLACIVIGFFLPMAPVVSALIGSAFWAGLLATAGALIGMSLSDAVLARLETNKSDAGSLAARDDRRPR